MQNFLCLRTLQRQLCVTCRKVFHGRCRGGMLENPAVVLVNVSGVDNQQKVAGGVAINQQVVHYAAIVVTHQRVQNLVVTEFSRITGD
ncbi:MAG: hypothetical protein DDT39_00670 [Firmicutes bacterium]|nr:hypothetical protein [candidate division NPL-UPA2 bacterium]